MRSLPSPVLSVMFDTENPRPSSLATMPSSRYRRRVYYEAAGLLPASTQGLMSLAGMGEVCASVWFRAYRPDVPLVSDVKRRSCSPSLGGLACHVLLCGWLPGNNVLFSVFSAAFVEVFFSASRMSVPRLPLRRSGTCTVGKRRMCSWISWVHRSLTHSAWVRLLPDDVVPEVPSDRSQSKRRASAGFRSDPSVAARRPHRFVVWLRAFLGWFLACIRRVSG
jgi:hypothetical protein